MTTNQKRLSSSLIHSFFELSAKALAFEKYVPPHDGIPSNVFIMPTETTGLRLIGVQWPKYDRGDGVPTARTDIHSPWDTQQWDGEPTMVIRAEETARLG